MNIRWKTMKNQTSIHLFIYKLEEKISFFGLRKTMKYSPCAKSLQKKEPERIDQNQCLERTDKQVYLEGKN